MSESKDVQDAKLRLEQARAQLDNDIATLTDRLPAAATVAQAGLAGGGGLAVLGIVLNWVKGRLEVRSKEKSLGREAQIQAKAIAAAIAAQTQATLAAEEARAAKDEKRAAKAAGRSARRAGDATSGAAGAGAAVVAASQAAGAAMDADDDDGVSWGLLLLVGAIVAAVVAYVTSQRDDDDIWITEEG